jgi:acyl-CoA thioesterase
MDTGNFFHPSSDPEWQKNLVETFNSCQFARLLGMVITEAAPGRARVVMGPCGKTNPNGVMHGGAIFSMADQAFGIAANLEDVPQVAVTASIWYLSPASGTLEAVARRISETTTYALYRVKIYQAERLIATFEGVGMKQACSGENNG